MQKIFGLVAAMAMIVVMLITSFEIAIYSDYGWYQKEYEKYQVLDDLEMEMQDVMDVTEEMMAYLRGDRKNLEVKTVIAGEEGMFFNEREKLHMEDVQGLFLGGIQIRRVAFVIFAAAVLLILFQKGNLREILPQMYGWAVGLFLGVAAVFGGLVAIDFNKYFVLFHEIFFNNDPATDLLIRMLPEGFFFDMVIRIGVIFIGSLLILWGAGALWRRGRAKKKS